MCVCVCVCVQTRLGFFPAFIKKFQMYSLRLPSRAPASRMRIPLHADVTARSRLPLAVLTAAQTVERSARRRMASASASASSTVPISSSRLTKLLHTSRKRTRARTPVASSAAGRQAEEPSPKKPAISFTIGRRTTRSAEEKKLATVAAAHDDDELQNADDVQGFSRLVKFFFFFFFCVCCVDVFVLVGCRSVA